MTLSYAACILAGVSLATANPVNLASRQNVNTNVCDDAARPALNTVYTEAQCPAINKLDGSGNCGGLDYRNNGCSSFCQTGTQFSYGQEVPYPYFCRGPFTCWISERAKVSVYPKGGFDLKYLKAVNFGTTGGYAGDKADSQTTPGSVSLNEGQCGYWTFIPVNREVCGTLTASQVNYQTGDPYCEPGTLSSQRLCAYDVRRTLARTADGNTVFVKADCGSRTPLPMGDQDPGYTPPGVALPTATVSSQLSSVSVNVQVNVNTK